jgi:hypothetical protein
MSDKDGSGRLFKRLALGGATAVVAAVAAVALGVPAGGCEGVALNFCDPKNWPDGDLPQIPCFCFGPGMSCTRYTDCCSMTCNNYVCTCTPNGDPCEEPSGCCSNICSFGFCAPADGGTGGGADGPIEACTGACLPAEPDFWSVPNLVWIGSEADAPPCPTSAATLAYEGRDGPSGPFACGACTCGPPSGSCGLPATITAASAGCDSDVHGVTTTPVDPPAGWDGGCADAGGVPAGASCDGGACVQSITFAPVVPSETGCASTAGPPEPGPVSWSSFARACKPADEDGCAGTGQRCVPPAPSGFRTCILQQGDVACPTDVMSAYTEHHTFYGGVSDLRSCSACACGAPSGSGCAASVSLYTDGACADLLVSATAGAAGPVCAGVPPGSALGSESAAPPSYTPGACAPAGGIQAGGLSPVLPATLCCLPPG